MRHKKEKDARLVLCGERSGPSYRRKDGLACNFVVVVREQENGLEVLSYAMHLAAPDGAQPGFLRWEYERERKDGVDAIREPLAHLHPGHDQVRLPAPILSPRELVAAFLGLPAWW